MDQKLAAAQSENKLASMQEAQTILAYRYFTHGIITANYFMMHHEVSMQNQDGISNKF